MAVEKKRARSEIEKAARRGAILGAARQAMLEIGYEAVTMADLARRAGLAKGTLYLYFKTKEELFLWLQVDLVEELVANLEHQLSEPMTHDGLIEALVGAVHEDELFLPLSARFTSVIEMNISDDALIEAKREMFSASTRMARALEVALDLPDGQGMSLALALQIALQGAAQFDLATSSLNGDYPEDVRNYIAASAFDKTFPLTIRLLIRGIQAP